MSCNGCRVLRKGCNESCILRPCLAAIEGSEAQGHATLFLAKFYGRAGLNGFISAVPETQRAALFQSLLFESCGRTINPVYGCAGLLWSGQWHVCEAAVETVLKGGSLTNFAATYNASMAAVAGGQGASGGGTAKAAAASVGFMGGGAGVSPLPVHSAPSPASPSLPTSHVTQHVHQAASQSSLADPAAAVPSYWPVAAPNHPHHVAPVTPSQLPHLSIHPQQQQQMLHHVENSHLMGSNQQQPQLCRPAQPQQLAYSATVSSSSSSHNQQQLRIASHHHVPSPFLGHPHVPSHYGQQQLAAPSKPYHHHPYQVGGTVATSSDLPSSSSAATPPSLVGVGSPNGSSVTTVLSSPQPEALYYQLNHHHNQGPSPSPSLPLAAHPSQHQQPCGMITPMVDPSTLGSRGGGYSYATSSSGLPQQHLASSHISGMEAVMGGCVSSPSPMLMEGGSSKGQDPPSSCVRGSDPLNGGVRSCGSPSSQGGGGSPCGSPPLVAPVARRLKPGHSGPFLPSMRQQRHEPEAGDEGEAVYGVVVTPRPPSALQSAC